MMPQLISKYCTYIYTWYSTYFNISNKNNVINEL